MLISCSRPAVATISTATSVHRKDPSGLGQLIAPGELESAVTGEIRRFGPVRSDLQLFQRNLASAALPAITPARIEKERKSTPSPPNHREIDPLVETVAEPSAVPLLDLLEVGT